MHYSWKRCCFFFFFFLHGGGTCAPRFFVTANHNFIFSTVFFFSFLRASHKARGLARSLNSAQQITARNRSDLTSLAPRGF